MPTPTFSRMDPAESRQEAKRLADEVAQVEQAPKFTNFQFAISLLVVAVVFAVFAYLVLW